MPSKPTKPSISPGRALQIFSKRFGNYPYPVFKVVEGPMRGGAGGMEYSGMTAIASSLYGDMGKQIEALAGSMGLGNLDKLFGDELGGGAGGDNNAPDTAAAGGMVQGILGEQKQMLDSIFEATIAHEVAHQWWAISVGSDSQRAPFVDESLTNYSAMLYFEDRYGKQTAQKMSEIHLRTAYSMSRMLGGADAPVALRTAAYANNLQYGAIVYGKGALYYEALRTLVGDEIFFRSLRQYARSRVLRTAVESGSGKSLARALHINTIVQVVMPPCMQTISSSGVRMGTRGSRETVLT
jgi:hypothetical protein